MSKLDDIAVYGELLGDYPEAMKQIRALVDQIIGIPSDYPSYMDAKDITAAQRKRAKDLLG